MMTKTTKIACLALLAYSAAIPHSALADEFEREPINYSRRSGDNRVTRLMADLHAGAKSLKHEANVGYLRSLLIALDVPQSSQTLVFSKTSLQRQRISPATPRALYFSDD